ncbi:MAG: tetratricopeptide repeat protein [Spirochaetia bacterium]|nr:tetratricopeptide repeat protein [Spirochaetia bacterium]
MASKTKSKKSNLKKTSKPAALTSIQFLDSILLKIISWWMHHKEKPDKVNSTVDILQKWRKLILEVIFLTFILSTSLILYIKVTEDKIIIEPFDVPPKLVELGYTKDTLASTLRDQMDFITENAFFQLKTKELIGKSNDNLSKVEVAGLGFSIDSIIQEIKTFIGHKDIRISGEVIYDNQNVTVIVRKNYREISSITGKVSEIRPVLASMAEAVEKQLYPHILAMYYYNQNRPFAEIENLIKYTLQKGNLEQKGYIHLLKALMFLEVKMLEPSIEECKVSAALIPQAYQIYNIWGIALDGLHRYNEGIDKYKQAVEKYPEYASAYNNWGLTLVKLKKYEEAIDKYKKAIRINPEYAYAYNNWGAALSWLKKYDQAVEKYQTAIKINPEYANAYNNWGVALTTMRQYDPAIEKFNMAILVNPKLVEAYNNIGDILKIKGLYPESVKVLQKAIEVNPDYSIAYFTLGEVFEKQGDFKKAIKMFELNIQHETNKENIEAVRNRILILKKLMNPGAKI